MRAGLMRLFAVLVMVGALAGGASAAPKTLGVDYEVMKGFMVGLGFKQKLGTPVNGMDNVVGDTKGAISQIVGNASGVASVGMTIIVDPKDEATSMANVVRMSRIVDAVFPGWNGGFDWIDGALRKSGDTLVRDGKKLTLTVVPAIAGIAMTIKPVE